MTMFSSGKIDSFTGEYAFLSNFYESYIRFRGRSYPTVEHAYQAAKAVKAIDKFKIRNASTPGQAKRLGRVVEIKPEWEDIKFDVMRKCLNKKFKIPELAQKLLDTGDKELIEGNTWGDQTWGVCKGKGKNLLGKLLMEIRQELKEQNK